MIQWCILLSFPRACVHPVHSKSLRLHHAARKTPTSHLDDLLPQIELSETEGTRLFAVLCMHRGTQELFCGSLGLSILNGFHS